MTTFITNPPTMMRKYNMPTAFVIFGGTGDLAKNKLLPSLLNLFARGILPDSFTVLCLSRKEMSDAEFQDFVRPTVNQKNNYDQKTVDAFCNHLRYVSGNFDDRALYESIKEVLKKFDDSIGQCTSKLFYLAVPPIYYSQIFSKLKESDAMSLCDQVGSWSRLLVEKPFGNDLETANQLEKQLCGLFSEDQIYRIDHYLEKDAIENIMSLRFANSIFFDIWNKENIESMALSLFETKDVSTRGSFYDGLGTLRDVGQNHMLQMLALLIMGNTDLHDAHKVRTARAQAIASLAEQSAHTVTRAQYRGFTETKGVSAESETETYFKIETELNDKQWKGVHISLVAGKALSHGRAEGIVTFRARNECRCDSEEAPHFHKNILTITFAPVHHISLKLWVKKPSFDFILESRELELVTGETSDVLSPEAYERVLYDCIVGDQTRFVSGEEVTRAWEFITPILETFKTLPLHTYEPGSNGPTL